MYKNIPSQKNAAFTLVELIVVVTIVAVLGTIGWISFFGIQLLARDTTRVSDITNIAKTIELSQLKQGKFPVVTNSINVTFSGAVIWQQGSFGEDSWRESQILSQIPIDPLTGSEYAYSTTQFTGEYQVGGIIEGGFGFHTPSLVSQTYAADILPNFGASTTKGNYNGKFIAYTDQVSEGNNDIYILGVPSILVNEIVDVSLEEIFLNDSFILEGQRTIPATFSGSLDAARTGWDFAPDIQEDAADNILPEYVIYKTTTQDLSTSDDKVSLVANLKDYYDDTELSSTPNFKDLESIDPVSDPVSALNLVNSFVSGIGVGGLSEDTTEVAQSEASQLTQVDTVSDACVDTVTPTAETYFTFDAGTQTITSYDTDGGLDVVIPCQIAGVDVVHIGDGTFIFDSLTNITIPDNITSIGDNAFRENSLTTLVIPDSVISIGQSAFHDNELISVTLGASVASIGEYAFGSNGLTDIIIPDSVTSIGRSSFAYNSLTSVVIPDSVTHLGNFSFSDNSLTSVVISNSVITIGQRVFLNNSLTSVVIPDSVTSIGGSTFAYNNLTSVVIPDSVTYIGPSAFSHNSLTSIVIPDSVTAIGTSAFSHNSLTSVVIPNSVTSMLSFAFSNNSLTSVVIPNSLTEIGNYAFYNNNLTSLDIPNSVIYIGTSAFSHNSLTSVVIPNSVISIRGSAFRLNSLTNITIPNSVTNIESNAFQYQTSSAGGGTIYGPAGYIQDLYNSLNGDDYFDIINLPNYVVQ